MVFVVDSCSWRHSDILKKKNLGLVQEPTDDIDDSVPVAEKSFILILTNQEQSLCLVYITMLMKVICMSIKQKFCIWKGLDDIPRVVLGKNCNLDDLFFLKSCFIKSSGNMLWFIIHEYLMKKCNRKIFLNRFLLLY